MSLSHYKQAQLFQILECLRLHKQYEYLVQWQSDCTFTVHVLKRLIIHGHLKNVIIPRFFFLFSARFHGAISIPRNVRTGYIYLWFESDNIRCINIQNVANL